MKYSIAASAFLLIGLVAAQSTTYPPFDTATTDPYPQHPPSMSDPRSTQASTASTTSVSNAGETKSTSTPASTFTVVSETSSAPTASGTPNDANIAKAGAGIILPGLAGVVAAILI